MQTVFSEDGKSTLRSRGVVRVALIGYGRMGHLLEQIAVHRGHTIVCRIDLDNPEAWDSEELRSADVALEFSVPATAEANVRRALAMGIPVVCGTTGWDVEKLKQEYAQGEGHGTEQGTGQNGKNWKEGTPWIWASNFSIGVNLFFAINRHAAKLMQAWKQYTPAVEETHHIHKLDKPSGTAKTIAADIEECGFGAVPVESIRQGEVAGIHTVTWESGEDTISLTHNAKSREGFALGAVIAAEWLQGKRGFHSMQEVLFGAADK